MRSGQLLTSTDVWLPHFQYERKTGTTDSRLIARSNFLRLIPEIAPHVIDDLWPTFWTLAFAICKTFGRELVGGSHRTLTGREIFLRIHARACQEYRPLIQNADWDIWSFRSLFATFEGLHRLDPERIAPAFRTCTKLDEGAIRTELREWSVKWNLNSEWCRDHALRVLVRLFLNKGLQESFLHPHDSSLNPYFLPPKAQTLVWRNGKKPIPGEPNNWSAIIWTSVARELLQDDWEREHPWEPSQPSLCASREILRWCTFEAEEPERFVLENSEFSDDGWNFLDESSTEFQRRVEINFLKYLTTFESRWLATLTSDLLSRRAAISDDGHIIVLYWRSRQLRQLRRALRIYVTSMNERKREVMKQGYLTPLPPKRKLEQHLTLALKYQIPTASLVLNPMSSLGKPSAVSKAVDEVLELTGLKKRIPNETGGRKLGSKNRFSSRDLGRSPST